MSSISSNNVFKHNCPRKEEEKQKEEKQKKGSDMISGILLKYCLMDN